MVRAAPAPLIAPEFDTVLAADVGPDRHGGKLSVLSALARLIGPAELKFTKPPGSLAPFREEGDEYKLPQRLRDNKSIQQK